MGYEYGQPPKEIAIFDPAWHEYMHYLYLPVAMPDDDFPDFRLPQRLEFLQPLLEDVIAHDCPSDCYVYVTARRGFATPGNPLNRPGWHADGFGSDDINYIWSDRWPTRFATGDLALIPGTEDDHVDSVRQWTQMIDEYRHRGGADSIKVFSGKEKVIYRLDPSVIHQTPIIPAPGGDRSFFKISISPDRYNLLGNSHNHLFDYEWKMWSRSEIRNDPAWAGGDAGPQ